MDKMKNIESLIKKAIELKTKGLADDLISEELNVSSETVTWLFTHAEETIAAPGPKDVWINWSTIGRSPFRVSLVSQVLADMICKSLNTNNCSGDVVVGIALSGLPLANMVANHLGADLAVYTPSKQMTLRVAGRKMSGNISSNFSDVKDSTCIIIDDVVTSGNTIEETIEYLRENGARIRIIAVLIDKRGINDIAGVPMVSMLKVLRIN